MNSTKRGKERPAPTPTAATTLQTGVRPRRPWLERAGFYEVTSRGIPSTTRQAEALRFGVSVRAGSERALVLGVDLDTGEIVFSDPVSDYAMPDGPRSTTRLALGDVGSGKSTHLKINGVLRPLLLGRRVAVVDKKLQSGQPGDAEGEYGYLARRLGVEPLRFATDGTGLRINVLDRAIAVRGRATDTAAGQTDLLRAILAEALGRPIHEREGKAVRVAHATALEKAQARGRTADVRDLIPALLQPTGSEDVTGPELRAWGLDCAFALERMVEEDLAGLVDGATDPRVELTGALTVFDISALPEDGPATPIAMAIINTWLANTLRQQAATIPTHFAVEEGWHLVQGSFGRVARRNSKLARGLGLVPEYALHHLSDIPVESPAMAMCREAGHVLMFKQAIRDDANAAADTYNLPEGAADILMDLPVGTALLWQSGRRPRVIQQVRSRFEQDVSNTDAALLSKATMRDLGEEVDDAEADLPTLAEAIA